MFTSRKLGKGRLPSVKDKYEEAVEAEAKDKLSKKVEKKPSNK